MVDRKKLLLASVIAAFLVVAFAGVASAQPFVIAGKILALDSSAQVVTLSQNECGQNGQYIFKLGEYATVTKGGELVSFHGLKVGDEVSVRYYQTGSGNFIAEDIGVLPPTMMMSKRC